MPHKTVFATTAIAALIATPALAADMAVKAAPRAPALVATSWTGLLRQRRRRLWP
jgi:hypothetical protein